MENTLFLRLEGPFQAWGERARWSVRDTAAEPTKSGITGLLGCALGWADDESLRSISQAIRVGVRCDRPGVRLIDYHTVVGGVLSAEGKTKINANTKEAETVVSERAYLCDASFLVAVQADPQWVARLSHAVRFPVWPVYLGRKSCPPALPVFAGVGYFNSLDEALASHPFPVRQPGKAWVRLVIESRPGEGKTRSDDLVSNSRRSFLPRYVKEITVELMGIPKEV